MKRRALWEVRHLALDVPGKLVSSHRWWFVAAVVATWKMARDPSVRLTIVYHVSSR